MPKEGWMKFYLMMCKLIHLRVRSPRKNEPMKQKKIERDFNKKNRSLLLFSYCESLSLSRMNVKFIVWTARKQLYQNVLKDTNLVRLLLKGTFFIVVFVVVMSAQNSNTKVYYSSRVREEQIKYCVCVYTKDSNR
jgi:hypothetical protein